MKERLISLRMMKVLGLVIKKLQKLMNIELAFEWPRGTTGWKEKIMGQIIEAMPLERSFDGCVYGLKDEGGKPLLKPWR
eukprot:13859794-Heterocapsa_arctica.AAC.1